MFRRGKAPQDLASPGPSSRSAAARVAGRVERPRRGRR